MLGAVATLFLQPFNALAALWNKSAFDAVKIEDSTKILAIHDEINSNNIQIIAPDLAENGAVVQVEVKSNIANTEAIFILVEKNPTSLIAHFVLSSEMDPYIVTRIKMAETSDIKIVVKAGTQYFSRSKNIVVLENGCGWYER